MYYKMNSYALCSNRISEDIKKALLSQGLTVVMIPDSPFLPSPVSSHADMLCFNTKSGVLVMEKNTCNVLGIHIDGAKIITDSFTQNGINEYPFDIRFNAALFEDFLFCREKYISPAIVENVNAKIVDVKQGYAGCSVCRVNSHSFITSDASLKKAGDRCGLDVLLIRPGFIGIDTYNYGFIGGASGLFGKKLLFYGDITSHPDYCAIHDFLKKRDVEEIVLSNKPLFDYGGMVII